MVKLTRDIPELLEQAKWGKLSEDEIDYVIEKIHNRSPDDDQTLYTLIYTLGRAEARKHRKLIENFLYYPSDPMISLIALKTLCDYWDLTGEYLDELVKFIKGVDWDANEDVRIVAISTAGEYLRNVFNKELLSLLIDIFGDIDDHKFTRESNDRNFFQCVAYTAIARAIGREYNAIPGITETLRLFEQGKLDLSVIQQAKDLLKSNGIK